jgi:hypothetical protein
MAKEERRIVERLKNFDDNAHYYEQHRAENKLANNKSRMKKKWLDIALQKLPRSHQKQNRRTDLPPKIMG